MASEKISGNKAMNGSHKHNDDIKDFVKSSLSQFEAEPPADLWDKIELRMRRRRRVVFIEYRPLPPLYCCYSRLVFVCSPLFC